MNNISQKIVALRTKLGLNQSDFAERLGFSRNYVSRLERGASTNPSRKFLKGMEEMEAEARVHLVAAKAPPAPYSPSKVREHSFSNAVPVDMAKVRKIPVYSFIQAGMATTYETLPESWEDTIEYEGPDENAFALRITGDSMEPKYPAGTIITLAPEHPAKNGDLVAACIRNEGPLFKVFHHSGDGKTITLTSFNQTYPALILPREKFHWIYKAVRATQKL